MAATYGIGAEFPIFNCQWLIGEATARRLAGARLSQPQRTARPSRVELLTPRRSANTVRANSAAAGLTTRCG